MSSLEINKIVGAALTAGIVAVASGFVADLLYAPEKLEESVYKVATAESMVEGAAESAAPAESSEAASEDADPLMTLLAAADAAAGQKALKKCTSCHNMDKGGPNKIGPNLWNIVNRQIGGAEGFRYSAALKDKASEVWSYENLDAFLAKPKDWAPGTKMSFGGITKPERRAALVAYLRTLSDSPAALPE
jgi:cytochrome c